LYSFFFQAEDGIRDRNVTGVQTCALPILDSMGWSITLGVIFCLLFWCVAKAANSGVPTKFQSAIEMIIEFVDSSVRDTFHGKSQIGRASCRERVSKRVVET